MSENTSAAAAQGRRMNSEIMADVSHEMLTPMNAIIGFTHLLRATSLTEDQKHRVDEIDKASHHLLGIIHDLLDVLRVASGSSPLKHEPGVLGELMRYVHEQFHARREARDVTSQESRPSPPGVTLERTSPHATADARIVETLKALLAEDDPAASEVFHQYAHALALHLGEPTYRIVAAAVERYDFQAALDLMSAGGEGQSLSAGLASPIHSPVCSSTTKAK